MADSENGVRTLAKRKVWRVFRYRLVRVFVAKKNDGCTVAGHPASYFVLVCNLNLKKMMFEKKAAHSVYMHAFFVLKITENKLDLNHNQFNFFNTCLISYDYTYCFSRRGISLCCYVSSL